MKAPKIPRKLNEKTVRAYKAATRRHDAERIRNGEDRWQVQRENSIFPSEVTSFRILRFA